MNKTEDTIEQLMGGLLTIKQDMLRKGYQVPHLQPMQYLEDVLKNVVLIRDYLRGQQTSVMKSNEGIAQAFTNAFNAKIEPILNNKNISAVQLKALSAIAISEAINQMLNITDNYGSDEMSSFTSDITDKLNGIIDDKFPSPSKEGKDIIGMVVLLYLLKQAVADNAYRIETIVTTEMQFARNQELEMAFSNADPEGKGLYKWHIIQDNRLTSCCRNIHNRVGNGVSLDRLREIVNDESAKYNAGNKHWEIRDWNPHINCRSTLVQVPKVN